MVELLTFVACMLGLAGAYRLYRQKPNIPRIFGVLLLGVWSYVSLVLLIISWFSPSLTVMLFLGALPVFVVAYGYRYYEHKYGKPQPPKRKNSEGF